MRVVYPWGFTRVIVFSHENEVSEFRIAIAAYRIKYRKRILRRSFTLRRLRRKAVIAIWMLSVS